MTAIASSFGEIRQLSDEERERRDVRRSRIAMAGILIAVSSAISSSLVYTANADREVGRQYAATLATYTEAAGQVQRVAELEARQQQTASQAAAFASLPQRTLPSVSLADVTNATPAGVTLLSLTIEPGADGTVHANIVGTAKSESDVAQFVERLNRSRGLKGAERVGTERDAKKFEINALLASDDFNKPLMAAVSPQASGSN